ncbi:DNA polymerase domain-containing protein [Haliangium sp.]|uniref:DNA polymerase domain-containing protein n=1 Tax=Haliangium sp. TaxID=2663208 RepID=UPI003D0FB91D
MAKPKPALLTVDGREVAVSSPDKVYFPEAGITKLELVQYYVSVGEGVMAGLRDRPVVLQRFVKGIGEKAFFQKRAPKGRPDWVETVTVTFPSGERADEVVVRSLADVAWLANMGCVTMNPHLVRADDLDHPDELRVDLDPCPDVPWEQVCRVALVVREVLEAHGLTGWPKTSGSRGMHIYARIERTWPFVEVRRAALALAREVERRAPELASSQWWKEQRHGVFLDFNQNLQDRTVAAAYSVRPVPGAWVSAPLTWDEVPSCALSDFTLRTVPERLAERGDPGAGIDQAVGSLDSLLALADEQAAAGLEDAPWPPHYKKQAGEPPRVAPSRRRSR